MENLTMSIEVNGKTIQTDEEGFLVNLADWSENVASANADGIDMTESATSRYGITEIISCTLT
jgi:sulfur relay (sulfurtransferase) DsrC/TusE family protein